MYPVGLIRRGASACIAIVFPLLLGAAPPDTTFTQRILAAHNRERALSFSPPLMWDDELSRGAQQWSDHLAKSGEFAHSPDSPGAIPLGENIWGGTVGRFEPEAMIGLWAAEKRSFKPGVFPNNTMSGRLEDVTHYTQLIWRSTTRVGCGLSKGMREEILVCRYSSAGNILGQRPI